MMKTLSVLVGLSMLGLVGAANAAEPVTLTEKQMDAVTAGLKIWGPFLIVNITGTLNSITGLTAEFRTETFYIISL
jgi:hypothetical protein